MDAAKKLETLRRDRGIQPPQARAHRLRITPADVPALYAESEADRAARLDLERAEATARERARRSGLVQAARFPARHLRTLMSGEPTWPDGCIDIAADAVMRRESVVLLSDRGRGKTLAACWIGARVAREVGVAVRYWRAADLLADIRHRCYSQGENESEVLRELGRVGLLVIDEFHERTGRGEFELPMMTRLLDHRYGEMAPTLIATNHSNGAAFEAAVGPSVMSRMQETALFVDLSHWPDRRAGVA